MRPRAVAGALDELKEELARLNTSKSAERVITSARRLADALAKRLAYFLDKLPDQFGGKLNTRKVQCPECRGERRVQTRGTILRWEPCLRCGGQGTVLLPVRKVHLDHALLTRKLSKLQRTILVALYHLGKKSELAFVPTKQIRRDLRTRKVPTSDVGFSRALKRLEARGLLERETGGSRETAKLHELLTRLTRLLTRLRRINSGEDKILAKQIAKEQSEATKRLNDLNNRKENWQTASVRLSAAGELTARALEENG